MLLLPIHGIISSQVHLLRETLGKLDRDFWSVYRHDGSLLFPGLGPSCSWPTFIVPEARDIIIESVLLCMYRGKEELCI